MDISVKFAGATLTEAEKEAVWKILVDCDGDFYPPLSSRESSHQAVLAPTGASELVGERPLPVKYFNEMISQEFIVAYANGEMAGFLTFRRNYSCEALADFEPSLYITTICVAPAMRKRGVMSALYDCLETEVVKSISARLITTRTWSLNAAQLHTLAKRGYGQVSCVPNDRGHGVDTIYFALKPPMAAPKLRQGGVNSPRSPRSTRLK